MGYKQESSSFSAFTMSSTDGAVIGRRHSSSSINPGIDVTGLARSSGVLQLQCVHGWTGEGATGVFETGSATGELTGGFVTGRGGWGGLGVGGVGGGGGGTGGATGV